MYPESKEDQYEYEAQNEIASEVVSKIKSDTEAERDNNNNNNEEAVQDNLSHSPPRGMPSIEFFSPEGVGDVDPVENKQYAIPIAIYMPSNPQPVKSLSEGDRYLLKCICVGDSDTGKSTFITNLEKYTISHISTIGIDFAIVEQDDCRFQVWDTAGQGRFRTITSAYYRGCHFALVFANVGAVDTANLWVNEAIKNLPDDYELYWIKNNAGKVEFVSCNELPIVEIEAQAFVSPQLLASKDECHQISQDILSLARERILMVQDLDENNDNNALPEDQNDAEEQPKRNCILM